jgi:hypothetical protein
MNTSELTGRGKLPSPQPSITSGQQSKTTQYEPFVDAEVAGQFLALPRRRVLELARQSKLPAYPLGTGPRKVWRFRLSEIADAVSSSGVNCAWQSPALA